MIKPLSDHILLEPVREEKKRGGIILPDTVDKERPERGKVIAVGPGKWINSPIGEGKRVPIEVKKGQVVLFKKYGPDEIKIPAGRTGGDDKEYLIAREEDILAVID